jgi:hypothetical protein
MLKLSSHLRALAPLFLLPLFAATPVAAQSVDFTAFRASCLAGAGFLIGEVPEGKDATPVMAVLCPCLETGFAAYSQPEIDALEADLRTGSSVEAKARYPQYLELQDKATGVLGACFAAPEVMSAAKTAGI